MNDSPPSKPNTLISLRNGLLVLGETDKQNKMTGHEDRQPTRNPDSLPLPSFPP